MTHRLPSICIVIPCYNEGSRLHFPKFKESLLAISTLHLLFVNDGSTDDTEQLLQAFASSEGRVQVVSFAQNQGKGEAVRQGVLAANTWQSFTYLGYFDADLSTPLSEVVPMSQLLSQTPEVLLVVGSRIKRMGAVIKRNELRHYVGRIFATFASLLLDLPIYDTQCGAKLFRNELVVIGFQESFSSKWLFDIELLARMIQQDGRKKIMKLVLEYPLGTWIEKGNSKVRLSDLFRVPFAFFRIYLRYFRE